MSVLDPRFRRGASFFLPVTVFLFSVSAPRTAQARLVDAILNFDASPGYALPAKLSQTGLYTNTGLKTRAITDGITAYDVNTALWSDGAHKERYITIPAGTNIVPTDTDHYAFPDKTVMIKNFAVDTIAGNDNSLIYIETRFLVVQKTASGYSYRGISYAWSRDQSDAYLVDQDNGLNMVIPIRSGSAIVGKRWRYPGRVNCLACHSGRGTLGFITPQLNRPATANPSINQLADLFAKGILSKNPLTASPNAVKWAALTDASASLELRSRSYFAANCSHCHGNGNKANVGYPHDFDFLNSHMEFMADTNEFNGPGYMDQPARSGSDPTTYPKLLNPGHADSSEIIRRMLTRGTFEVDVFPNQMPILATYEPDSAAVRVIADWTCMVGGKPTGAACKLPSIEQPAAPAGIFARRHEEIMRGEANLHAVIKAGILTLGIPGMSDAPETQSAPPVLSDIHGKHVALRAAGAGRYAVPEALPSGTYFLRWQGQSIAVTAGI